jgi:D-alanine-D-alanine ligase
MQEKFLPGAGENQTPAPLTLEHLQLVQQQIERAYESLELRGYARIDCFFQSAAQSPTGSERVVMLEVNTLPALTPATCLFHQAAEIGMSPMQVIDTIVQLGLEEHGAARIAKCSLPATRENI